MQAAAAEGAHALPDTPAPVAPRGAAHTPLSALLAEPPTAPAATRRGRSRSPRSPPSSTPPAPPAPPAAANAAGAPASPRAPPLAREAPPVAPGEGAKAGAGAGAGLTVTSAAEREAAAALLGARDSALSAATDGGREPGAGARPHAAGAGGAPPAGAHPPRSPLRRHISGPRDSLASACSSLAMGLRGAAPLPHGAAAAAAPAPALAGAASARPKAEPGAAAGGGAAAALDTLAAAGGAVQAAEGGAAAARDAGLRAIVSVALASLPQQEVRPGAARPAACAASRRACGLACSTPRERSMGGCRAPLAEAKSAWPLGGSCARLWGPGAGRARAAPARTQHNASAGLIAPRVLVPGRGGGGGGGGGRGSGGRAGGRRGRERRGRGAHAVGRRGPRGRRAPDGRAAARAQARRGHTSGQCLAAPSPMLPAGERGERLRGRGLGVGRMWQAPGIA